VGEMSIMIVEAEEMTTTTSIPLIALVIVLGMIVIGVTFHPVSADPWSWDTHRGKNITTAQNILTHQAAN
jgi:hypothetical protein